MRKKVKKVLPFQNGGHFTDFPVAYCAIPLKLKDRFSDEIFRLKVADHQ